MNNYLYKYLCKAITFRALELAIANNYPNQQMRCPVHLSIGQEYWLPCVSDHYVAGDRFFSSHRSHSLFMALGCNPVALIAELHGHPDGCLGGKGGSMHLHDVSKGLISSTPIVGSSIPLAIGSALASKHLSERVLTVSYFGDGACEEGAFHESLNLASVLDLPILFICENNLYSCNTKISRRQSSARMSRFADAHGIPSATVSYQRDLQNTIDTISRAFTAARSNPFFLEIYSNRIYQHCGHLLDLDTGDRTEEEQTYLNQLDPLNCAIDQDQSLREYLELEYIRFCQIVHFYQSLNNEYWFNA
jgi:TPP-dependent pyruvate/acetoin dehydrogenase alpha subunit